jgi:putative transposase
MPWRVQTPMTARRDFIEDWLRGLYSMTDLCARYGISRRVGYKCRARFERAGFAGLEDQRRTPHHSPNRIAPEIAAALLAARRAHPTWGPRKLLPYLQCRQPNWAWPVASTVGELLRHHGLVAQRRRRPRPGHPGRPTSSIDGPNTVWTADFKGQFRLGCGAYCYPLTVGDAYSRYFLGCQGLATTSQELAQPIFERLFRAYGLPARLRTDNGPPFATCALGRLSQLSLWWLKLGITPELIEPAHPEQNGRHERLHRTLKAEATKPACATLAAQQRRFNAFRQEYNEERPHEALAQRPPVTAYAPSPRAYPAHVPAFEYPAHFERRRVSRNGGIRWHKRWINVSHVLAEEDVGLEEIGDAVWAVYIGPLLLGRFEEREGRIYGAHNRNRL